MKSENADGTFRNIETKHHTVKTKKKGVRKTSFLTPFFQPCFQVDWLGLQPSPLFLVVFDLFKVGIDHIVIFCRTASRTACCMARIGPVLRGLGIHELS